MKRILIVDDDKDFTESLASLLKEKYEVVSSSNGFTAITKVGKGGVDLILLDLVMPGLDGPGFLDEVRKDHPTLPVIVVSAHSDLEAKARGLQIEDFLVKPVDIAVLETRIDRLIGAGRSAP
jgi:DNA-binding response OmpR family regulator